MKIYMDIFITKTVNILRSLMFEGNGNLVTEPECVQEPLCVVMHEGII